MNMGYCRNHHRRGLLEEIVGNIFDEYDDEEHKYEKVDESTYFAVISSNRYRL